jgi:ribosomal protein L1
MKAVPLKEAVPLLKQFNTTKFDQSVEVPCGWESMLLADQIVRARSSCRMIGNAR